MSAAPARRHFLAGALGWALAGNYASAREIAGVTLEDEARLESGAQLKLTGAGVFRFLLLRYYACGLYLPAGTSPEAWTDVPRRIGMVMLRNVSAWEFILGLDRGLSDNTEARELDAMGPRIVALKSVIRAIGSVPRLARVSFQYEPVIGTRVFVDGAAAGAAVPGKDLNDAVMKVWIGSRPLDASLKAALLGGPA